jgi:translation initiation factor 4E
MNKMAEVPVMDEARDEVESEDKKHPLQNKWTLWYLMGDPQKRLEWGDRLKPVATFGSVEDFWA